MFFWKYCKKKKGLKHVPNFRNNVEHKSCLCFFSVTSNGSITINLKEDESHENEIEANNIFENYKKQKRNVYFNNYRAGLYKFYNANTGKTVQQRIVSKARYPVDLDSIITAIHFISNEYENNQIPPEFIPIIYKLLIDKVLGIGYEDLKATTFRSLIEKEGFTKVGRSSFSKFKPHGKYPNWNYDNGQFKKDKIAKKEKALGFAKKFVKVYDDFRLQSVSSKADEAIGTAEETAE